ncbi:hypothetical protein B0T18DRAFT_389074 [Schizothecium vesticola]|uniref:RRM domain-containing protein n=1 Tax=Schizothecium vesticola TaxID=314040 RepID=A0AA40F1J5_9PEZI|nr:hypothetical protein B0T18DRAFT_389074 [Schizothecium vesticola]
MADEEFEIDVYGSDAGGENGNKDYQGHGDAQDHGEDHKDDIHDNYQDQDNMDDTGDHRSPTPQRPQQGVKRKEGSDERPVDPGATSALMISDLNWWNTDDDVRGWVQQANCEGELKDITFSEHKVNGKSKGQAYLEFTSQQAATATKHLIENAESSQPGHKRRSVTYSSPSYNPFRTLPKDAPNRGTKDGQTRAPSGPGFQDRSSSFQGNTHNGNFRDGGFRGGRGGYNGSRGGGMNSGGYNNRSYQGNSNNMPPFNPGMGGGFPNPMGGAGFNAGFNNRGGGMVGGGMRGGPGMRGGRGGGMNGMMGGGMMPMPMGGPMAAMGGPMGPMGMPMGGPMPGFPNMQPQFNPAFFGGGNQSNDWQNPHGAKRARGE